MSAARRSNCAPAGLIIRYWIKDPPGVEASDTCFRPHRLTASNWMMARYLLSADGNVMFERRKAPRYDVALEIEIHRAHGHEVVHAVTTNISEGGLQITAPEAFIAGGSLRFRCPAFRGRIEPIWSRREGDSVRTGFRFAMLDWRDHDALLALLSELKRKLALDWRSKGLPPVTPTMPVDVPATSDVEPGRVSVG